MEEYIFKKADSDDEEHFLANHGKRAFAVTPIEDSVIKKAMEGDEAAFDTLFMGTYRYVFATVCPSECGKLYKVYFSSWLSFFQFYKIFFKASKILSAIFFIPKSPG